MRMLRQETLGYWFTILFLTVHSYIGFNGIQHLAEQ